MVKSGKYLVERHRKLLRTLLKLSKKRKLEITLIGHSLGAGAATIAAMEWNSKPLAPESSGNDDGLGEVPVSARVVGFGCPALLSRSLSLAVKPYVTSIIADADFIPRLSGATLVNLLMDVSRFEYRVLAARDVEQALRELQRRLSGSPAASLSPLFNIDEDDIRTIMGYVQRGLKKMNTPSSATKSTGNNLLREQANITEKMEPVLSSLTPPTLEPVLFPPGECIHFYRDGSSISGAYVPCDFFNEIDIARTMIDDHLISSGYRKIFLTLMRDFHKDDHFSFESHHSGE